MVDKKVVELIVSGGQANAGPPLGRRKHSGYCQQNQRNHKRICWNESSSKNKR
jgi:hypothetical protein